MAVQQAVGPVLVTTVLVGWGRLGWLALALLLTAGTLAARPDCSLGQIAHVRRGEYAAGLTSVTARLPATKLAEASPAIVLEVTAARQGIRECYAWRAAC